MQRGQGKQGSTVVRMYTGYGAVVALSFVLSSRASVSSRGGHATIARACMICFTAEQITKMNHDLFSDSG